MQRPIIILRQMTEQHQELGVANHSAVFSSKNYRIRVKTMPSLRLMMSMY